MSHAWTWREGDVTPSFYKTGSLAPVRTKREQREIERLNVRKRRRRREEKEERAAILRDPREGSVISGAGCRCLDLGGAISERATPDASGFPNSRGVVELFLALSSNFIGLLRIDVLLDDFLLWLLIPYLRLTFRLLITLKLCNYWGINYGG